MRRPGRRCDRGDQLLGVVEPPVVDDRADPLAVVGHLGPAPRLAGARQLHPRAVRVDVAGGLGHPVGELDGADPRAPRQGRRAGRCPRRSRARPATRSPTASAREMRLRSRPARKANGIEGEGDQRGEEDRLAHGRRGRRACRPRACSESSERLDPAGPEHRRELLPARLRPGAPAPHQGDDQPRQDRDREQGLHAR